MAEADGRVRIAISFNTGGADKAVQSVSESFRQLGQRARQAISGVSMRNVENEARSTSDAIQGIRDDMQSMTGAEAKAAAALAKQLAAVDSLMAQIEAADNKTASTLASLSAQQQTLEDNIRRTTEAANQLQAEWDKIDRTIKRDSTTGDILPGQDKTIAQLDKLGGKMADLDDKTRKYQAQLDIVKQKIQAVNDTQLGEGGQRSALQSKLEAAEAAAESLRVKLNEVQTAESVPAGGGIAENITGAFRSGFRGIGDSAKKLFGGIASQAKRSFGQIVKMGSPVEKLFQRIGRSARQVFIVGSILTTLRAARDILSNIVAQDNTISKQMSTIKGNLYAAFAPLWEAVYPAVVAILNGIVAITSALANLSAQLFGGVSSGAEDAAGALYGEADAIGAVGSAAGSAAKELGAFDEINKVGDSGGGGSQYSAGLMTNLSWTMQDLYDRLMALNWEAIASRINDALLGIDFVRIGRSIKNGVLYVVNALSTLLEGIDWRQLGSNVASGLNELFGGDTLPDLAGLLADWWNAKINLFYGFVKTFDWKQLGTNISRGINRFFADTDWLTLGEALNTFGLGVLDALIAALDGVNWENIGQSIRDFVAGINWTKWTLKIGNIIWNVMKGLGEVVLSLTGVTVKDGGLDSNEIWDGLAGVLTAVLGFAGLLVGGKTGGFLALTLGISLALLIGKIKAGLQNGEWDVSSIMQNLANLLGTALGLTFLVGGGIGFAALGLLVPISVSLVLQSLDWSDVREYSDGLIAEVEERVVALNDTLSQSTTDIMANQFARVSTGPILKSVAGEEEFAAQMQAFGIQLDDLNSRANHTIETYVQLRTELRSAYEVFAETGDIETYRQTLLGLGLDAETVEAVIAQLAVSTGAISDNTGAAAEAMDDVESSMKSTAKQGEKLETSMAGVTDETGNADEALQDEYVTLGNIESEFGSAETANENLAESTGDLADATYTGIVSMDEALQNNLSGWSQYATQLSLIMDTIADSQTTFWSDLTGAAADAVAGMKSEFATLASNVESSFTQAWNNVVAAMSDGGTGFDSITNGVKSAMRSSLNSVINGLNSVMRNSLVQMNTVLQQLRSANVMGSYPFASIKNIRIPTIPRLAQGAVIPANREFLAVLGDQKRGTNVEAPLDTITEAMMIALSNSGGTGARPEDIAAAVKAALTDMSVVMDGSSVGRVVARAIDANRRADGKFAYDLA